MSPDGRTFTELDASWGELRLWKHVGGHLRSTTLEGPWRESPTAAVSNNVFSPDGKTLAVTRFDAHSDGGDSGPGVVEVWDVASRSKLVSHAITVDKGAGLAYSRDGGPSPPSSPAATSPCGGSATTRRARRSPATGKGAPGSLVFSHDLLAVGGGDAVIRLYDLRTDGLVMSWPTAGKVK